MTKSMSSQLYSKCALIAACFLTLGFAFAGELILHNASSATITCTADGYTTDSGWTTTWHMQVAPGQKFYVAPNYGRPTPLLDWVECSGLRTRNMRITPQGPDGLLVLNGLQKRTLNVLLYPYIPSDPPFSFSNLVKHVIYVFQATHPDVLLNIVMNPDVDVYNFSNLPELLGASGYDVVELDTVFMSFLVANNLLAPAKIVGDAPWPTALTNAQIGGIAYGVPSWMCTSFDYAFNMPPLTKVATLPQLLAIVPPSTSTRLGLTTDYNGSWTMIGMYINGYMQTYGIVHIADALKMPPDPTVVGGLAKLVRTCGYGATNLCIDNTFHQGTDGAPQRMLGSGGAAFSTGFSEQSFYALLAQAVPGPLYAVPAVWGTTQQPPLLYVDAFVTNRALCGTETLCYADSTDFTAMMTGSTMKSFIAFSRDLAPGAPARRLLVATQPFYGLPEVKGDALYQQFAPVVSKGYPYPNDFTDARRKDIYNQVCSAMKAQVPGYICGSTSGPE